MLPQGRKSLASMELPALIPFSQDGKWGFCNRDRELVIAAEYDWVDFFRTDQGQTRARVRQGKLPQDWLYGMINGKGERCIPLEYANLEPFSCGRAKMRRQGKTLYGFLDDGGHPLTQHEFASAQSFSEGWAYVTRPAKRRVEEHGFLNTDGELQLTGTLLFDDAIPFEQGFSVVTHYAARGYFYSYLKPDGLFLKVHRPPISLDWFCSASPFHNQRALVYREFTGFAIIEPGGQMVADLGYAFEAAYPARDGLIRVQKDSNWGFLDSEGREVIPCMVDYAKVGDFSCGRAAFQESPDGPWGFFDRHLHTVVAAQYCEVGEFCQGLAAVRCGDLYGFVNNEGQEVIPPRYSYVGSFENGLALCKLDGSAFYVDAQGREYR
jgi:hypothetical protein